MKIFYTKNNKLTKDLTFTVLSDIHYVPGFNLNYLYSQIDLLEQNPTDYVFILGDIINDSKYSVEELKEFRNWLCKLSSVCKKNNIKIFTVLGNHDQMTKKDRWYEYYNKEYVDMIKNIDGFNLLENNVIKDGNVSIGGTKFYGNYYINHEPIEQYFYKMQKFRWPDHDTFNILLDHSPKRVFDKNLFNIISGLKPTDFVLSGHYHNGCVPNFLNFIPTNRGIISPYMDMFPKNARGSIKINDRTQGFIAPAIVEFSNDTGIFQKLNFLYKPTSQKILIKKNNTNI